MILAQYNYLPDITKKNIFAKAVPEAFS